MREDIKSEINQKFSCSLVQIWSDGKLKAFGIISYQSLQEFIIYADAICIASWASYKKNQGLAQNNNSENFTANLFYRLIFVSCNEEVMQIIDRRLYAGSNTWDWSNRRFF